MKHVLHNAILADGSRVDMHIADGRIESIQPPGEDQPVGQDVEDLGGWLLLGAMAEPHAHLDKALTAERVPNHTGDLLGAIEAWGLATEAGEFTYQNTLERASRAMELLLFHGVTAVRTHVNVGGGTGVQSVLAVREARARFEGLLDVEIVALTHSPMTGPEGADNRAFLAEALEIGVDLVGGAPHLDPDGAQATRQALAAATEAGIGIDLHTDETLDASVLLLRDLAHQVIDTGFPYRVTASHCVSLGMQTPKIQALVAKEVAEAGISIVPLPQTNLFLQGRGHTTGMPRGLTAINALLDAGVVVAAGADNVQDPFNPVGRSDPLETAALMIMAAHTLPDDAYRMVSNDVRKVMGFAPVTMSPGDPADFVAIDAESTRAAIADAPMSRRTYRAGRLVASADQTVSIHRN